MGSISKIHFHEDRRPVLPPISHRFLTIVFVILTLQAVFASQPDVLLDTIGKIRRAHTKHPFHELDEKTTALWRRSYPPVVQKKVRPVYDALCYGKSLDFIRRFYERREAGFKEDDAVRSAAFDLEKNKTSEAVFTQMLHEAALQLPFPLHSYPRNFLHAPLGLIPDFTVNDQGVIDSRPWPHGAYLVMMRTRSLVEDHAIVWIKGIGKTDYCFDPAKGFAVVPKGSYSFQQHIQSLGWSSVHTFIKLGKNRNCWNPKWEEAYFRQVETLKDATPVNLAKWIYLNAHLYSPMIANKEQFWAQSHICGMDLDLHRVAMLAGNPDFTVDAEMRNQRYKREGSWLSYNEQQLFSLSRAINATTALTDRLLGLYYHQLAQRAASKGQLPLANRFLKKANLQFLESGSPMGDYVTPHLLPGRQTGLM